MIRGNGWGIAIAVTGGLLGGMSSYFLKLTDPQALMILGAAWSVLDAMLRALRRHQPHWLVNPQAGGFVWHIPVWVFGLAIFLVSALVALTP